MTDRSLRAQLHDRARPDGADRCRLCRTGLPHPPAVCPVCHHETAHLIGIYLHLGNKHAIFPGRRVHALAMDLTRARIRGWMTDEPTRRFAEALAREGVAA